LSHKVHVRVQGDGAPIIMVHGFALDQRMWVHQVSVLSEHYRVVAVDVPGCGKSSMSDLLSIAGIADTIMEAVLPFLEERRTIYMGLSMGGYIGWEILSRYSNWFAAAVMCDTRASADTAATADGRRQMATKALETGTESVMKPMLPRLVSEETLRDQPETLKLMEEMMFSTEPQTIHNHQLAMADRHDFQSELSRFSLPILLICGTDDILTPPKEMKRLSAGLPQSTFAEIPEAGHMAPLEQPGLVNQHLLEFLGNLWAK
jgi:3-oxoadipate enol-lactonase